MTQRSVARSGSLLVQSVCRTTPRRSHLAGTLLQHRAIASAAAVVREPAISDYPSVPEVSSSDRTRRRNAIKTARPFSSFLTDTFQRQHDYLRISITEKCNLRCLYCMPEEGVPQSPPPDLLTTPEIFLLSSLFVSQGVTKIRLTGGEPTVRRDIIPLMHQIGSLRPEGLRELCLTTNGISLHRKLDSMVEAGLTGVNLSLDTLDPWQFQIMTRRKGFEAVMKSIERILEMNKLGAGIKLKINCVVMRGMNDKEIVPFVELGREKDLEVRFIEYMPFDGNKWSEGKMLGYKEMLEMIQEKYPSLRKVQDHKNDTSKTYEIPGFVGKIGFITSMTHNFCGTCNRLRITSDGNLKVCLFGNAEVSLRDILRQSNRGKPIDEQTFEVLQQIGMDKNQMMPVSHESFLTSSHEQQLLEVIGMAVHGKKAKHAGMGELENMKNRPMILIDKSNQVERGLHRRLVIPRNLHHTSLQETKWQRIPLHVIPSFVKSAALRHNSTSSILSPDKPQPQYLKSEIKLSSKEDIRDPVLTHLTQSGEAHMVSISSKTVTKRTAIAACSVRFSNPTAADLIRSNRAKKGDVLGVARLAGIMASKRTAELIPLCHPIAITHVSIEIELVEDCVAASDEKWKSATFGDRGSIPWAGTGQGDAYHWPSSTARSLAAIEPGATDQQLLTLSLIPRIDISATVSCEGKTGVEMEALTAASVAALTVYDMCKAVDKGMRIESLRVIRKEGGMSGTWIEGKSAA